MFVLPAKNPQLSLEGFYIDSLSLGKSKRIPPDQVKSNGLILPPAAWYSDMRGWYWEKSYFTLDRKPGGFFTLMIENRLHNRKWIRSLCLQTAINHWISTRSTGVSHLTARTNKAKWKQPTRCVESRLFPSTTAVMHLFKLIFRVNRGINIISFKWQMQFVELVLSHKWIYPSISELTQCCLNNLSISL